MAANWRSPPSEKLPPASTVASSDPSRTTPHPVPILPILPILRIPAGAFRNSIAVWVTARYLLTVRKLAEKSAEGELQLKLLREFSQDIVAMRRADHSAARLKLEQERQDDGRLKNAEALLLRSGVSAERRHQISDAPHASAGITPLSPHYAESCPSLACQAEVRLGVRAGVIQTRFGQCWFMFNARPHLLSSPPGEEIAALDDSRFGDDCPANPVVGFQNGGGRFSLSPGEWCQAEVWGGFLGRKADGEPGTQTMWLGLQRLDDLAAMYLVMRQSPSESPAVSSDRDYG